jgi:hypothetical protein
MTERLGPNTQDNCLHCAHFVEAQRHLETTGLLAARLTEERDLARNERDSLQTLLAEVEQSRDALAGIIWALKRKGNV